MVVELSVVLSMEAEAVGVGDGGVVDSAGELRATKGAGGGVADATDVVVNSFSNRWRLRSNARCILVNSKAAMIPLTLAEVVGDSEVMVGCGGGEGVVGWRLGLHECVEFGGSVRNFRASQSVALITKCHELGNLPASRMAVAAAKVAWEGDGRR